MKFASLSLPGLVATVTFLVGVVLTAFGWWGQHTATGRRQFDEMAGTIPLAAHWVGWGLIVATIAWIGLMVVRSRG
jgi:hypothetical protein